MFWIFIHGFPWYFFTQFSYGFQTVFNMFLANQIHWVESSEHLIPQNLLPFVRYKEDSSIDVNVGIFEDGEVLCVTLFRNMWTVPVLYGKQSNRTDYNQTMIRHKNRYFWTTIPSQFTKRPSYSQNLHRCSLLIIFLNLSGISKMGSFV